MESESSYSLSCFAECDIGTGRRLFKRSNIQNMRRSVQEL
jgi:hypothetical protein